MLCMKFQLTSSIDWNEFSDDTVEIKITEDIPDFEGECHDFTYYEGKINMSSWKSKDYFKYFILNQIWF